MVSGNELCSNLGINCVRCQWLMVSVTRILHVIGAQWRRLRGLDKFTLAGVSPDSTVSVIVIGAPYGDILPAGCLVAVVGG